MKIFDAIPAFLHRFRSGASVDPARDWLTVLTFSTIVLLGIIVWNIWAFDTVANGGVIGTAVPNTTLVFNRSSLDTIHTIFENRAAEESKYVTGTYRFADPSQ